MRVILASASPRRRELLGLLQVPFKVVPAAIDEAVHPGEAPRPYVERVCRQKAEAVERLHPDAAVLAADTSVVIDGEILGKPGHDARLGAEMLRRLGGRTHEVLTAVAVATAGGTFAGVFTSRVTFRLLSEAEVAWYVGTGEGADKAGGYAVQGHAGAFITAVDGSPTNVIGLPLAETVALLRRAGVRLPMDGGGR
jgi:septum formation protein